MTSNPEFLTQEASSIRTQTTSISPDFSFLREVEEASGEKVSLCYRCRKCSSGCPVSFAMDYVPDVLLRRVQFGLRDSVLNSTTIWICASCETCTTRCPNEIDIAGVMDTLRQMALASGFEARAAPEVRDIPIFHMAFVDSIGFGGRVYEAGMVVRYMLKTNPRAKLKSGELVEQAKFGWQMFKRGKFKLLPHRIRRTGEIKKLFKKGGR